MTEARKPWQPIPGETNNAYRYFCAYMDQMLGQRSLAKLAKKVGRSSNALEKMSSKFHWQARVAAWDQDIAQKIANAQADAIVEMRKRHIQIGVGFQTAVVKELQALVNKIEKAAATARELAIARGEDPAKAFHEPILSASEIVKLSQHGIELERLTRGLATAKIDNATQDDEKNLERLSLAELKALKEIQAKLGT